MKNYIHYLMCIIFIFSFVLHAKDKSIKATEVWRAGGSYAQISPNGRYVAYTGSEEYKDGEWSVSRRQFIVVRDLDSGKIIQKLSKVRKSCSPSRDAYLY